METYSFKQVDVFTDKPFWGNPVAVILGATELTTDEMQRIAAWTNLSETTFVLPSTVAHADYRLRIFHPKGEMPFAGHPTIGSAHAIIESGFVPVKEGKLRQECLAGVLDLRTEEKNGRLKIWVKAPPAVVTPVDLAEREFLRQALSTGFVEDTPPLRIDVGPVWIVINMGDAERVASLNPDMNLMTLINNDLQVSGVTVFGRASDGVSALHVRSFAPADGVPEDPVWCIRFGEGSRVSRIYVAEEGVEEYHCNFGFNPRYLELKSGEIKVVGRDEDDEVRVVEHSHHPFIVATLFQPELSALRGSTHPLICALMRAAKDMTA